MALPPSILNRNLTNCQECQGVASSGWLKVFLSAAENEKGKKVLSSQALTPWCGRSRDSKRGEHADGSPGGDRGGHHHHHQQQEHHPYHHHSYHQENKDLVNMWLCTAVTPLVQQLAESPYTEQDVLHAIGLLQTNTVSIGLPVH